MDGLEAPAPGPYARRAGPPGWHSGGELQGGGKDGAGQAGGKIRVRAGGDLNGLEARSLKGVYRRNAATDSRKQSFRLGPFVAVGFAAGPQGT